MPPDKSLCVAAFETELGWLALAGSGSTVKQLTFGYRSQAAALAAVDPEFLAGARELNWFPSLVRRLEEYVQGAPHDFRDVELDLDHLTPFARRVVKHCREIGYGRTQSYGELAAASGAARAARAVGNTMAGNRYVLLVPCHRVVHSGGDAGQLSRTGRVRMILRRLETEGPSKLSVPRAKRRGRRRARAGG